MEGDRKGYKKGLWTEEEDRILMDYIKVHGKGRWNRVAKMTGLKRCGKSCRLRWINYLSPSIKHGDFSEEEDDLIIRLHKLLGNRWSLIAGRVPGRTDNQVKNHWNTHLSKKLGIRKAAKTKLSVAASPAVLFEKTAADNVEISPMDSNSNPASHTVVGAENQKVPKQSSENEFGFFDVEEPTVNNDSWESPFWFSNLDTPSLMEHLDQYSADFDWQGL